MSDPTSRLPAAGWYGDPSDPSGERWWGGLEWTEHIRPLDVAPPVAAAPMFPPPTSPAPAQQPPPPASALASGAQAFGASAAPAQFELESAPAIPQFASQATNASIPQFASQQTGAVPQFASQQPATPFSASQFTTAEEAASAFGAAAAAPATGSWPAEAATGSPFGTTARVDPYAAFGGTNQSFGGQPIPDWNASAGRPSSEPQSNAPAVTGFVMSLLGFGLISLIISIVGVKKATRLENAGGPATGRVLGRWGIALSIVGMVAGLIAAAAFGYWLYLAGSLGVFDDLGADTGTSTSQTEAPVAPAVVGANPVADAIASDMADDMDFMFETEAQSVTCPADATDTAGSVVTCDIVLLDGRAVTGTRTFDTAGGFSTTYVEN